MTNGELGARHCSLASGAFTDFLTNVVSLDHTALGVRLPELLTPGGMPRTAALDFLHESAHQWCFDSPVGRALAYLETRAIYLAYNERAREAGGDDRRPFQDVGTRAVWDAVIRVRTARELLRPLAEGIAMFVELDAATGDLSQTASAPLLALPVLFGGATDRPDVTAMIQEVLRDVRTTDDALRRRRALLAEPLVIDAGGTYLAGYLTVKNIWLSCCRQAPTVLIESDRFVSFLRAWIYRDYGLVHAILDEDVLEWDVVTAVAKRLFVRLQQFTANPDLADDLEDYEDWIGDGDASFDHALINPPIFLHPDETYVAGVKDWMRVQSFIADGSQSDVDGGYRDALRLLTSTRHLVNIGSVEGDVEVDVGGQACLRVDGEIVWRARVDPSFAGNGPGSVEVMYSTHHPAKHVALVRAGEVLVVGSQETADEVRHLLGGLDRFWEVASLRSFLRDGDRLLVDLLDTIPPLRERRDELQRGLPGIVADLYRSLTVPHRLDAHREALLTDGLLGLPGLDRPRFAGIALLGLTHAARMTKDETESEFGRHRLSYASTVEFLTRINDETGGVPLLAYSANRVVLASW